MFTYHWDRTLAAARVCIGNVAEIRALRVSDPSLPRTYKDATFICEPVERGDATIRRIAPDGTARTLAGTPRVRGSANGVGAQAQFNSPSGIAVDAAGSVYVADTFNHVIRRVAPDGTVSTVASLAGVAGSADGVGEARASIFRAVWR